jgi:hypothetical protein
MTATLRRLTSARAIEDTLRGHATTARVAIEALRTQEAIDAHAEPQEGPRHLEPLGRRPLPLPQAKR